MDLPDGKTCADCIYVVRCTTMYGAKPENKFCGFELVRFRLNKDLEVDHDSCIENSTSIF